MADIKIRRARAADLPAILSLHAELDSGEGDILPVEEARRIFSKIRRYPDYRIYVASAGREIVGTFALLVMDNLAHRGAPSAIIEDVVVRRNRQRKGIGRRMMRFAMDYCRRKGCYKVALSSNLRRDGAHRFYEALGFQRHGYSFMTQPEKEGPAV